MKKLKTFVITVSKQFPKTHLSAGQPTDFANKIYHLKKKHTIRHNYEWWKPRIDAINRGEAILSIRQWIGLPYKKPGQTEIAVFGKGEVGIQKCDVSVNQETKHISIIVDGMEKIFAKDDIITNDGLNWPDFRDWFKEPVKDGCIIHFTDLRY